MKWLALLIFLALPFNSIRADVLANDEFKDGAAHWKGDGRGATDIDPTAVDGGLVVQLNPTKWTKIWQIFNTKEDALDFNIGYKTSTDCAFTTDPSGNSNIELTVEDLLDLTGMRYTSAIRIKAGQWLMMVDDPSRLAMTYYEMTPKIGTPDIQSMSGKVPKLVAHREKVLRIAFPPGKGTITFFKIILTPGVDATP